MEEKLLVQTVEISTIWRVAASVNNTNVFMPLYSSHTTDLEGRMR